MIYIICTIDTENLQTPYWTGKYSVDLLDYYYNNEPLTTSKFIEVFNQHDISATFFLAVNEADNLSNDTLAALAKKLVDNNQDVQIHSHPIWSDQQHPAREFMYQYSKEEQYRLLQDMISRLTSWTNTKPIAHRAGAYGANNDTLMNLSELNIPIDSSMFHKHKHCKINWSINRLVEKNGVLEIPVTGFYKKTEINLLGKKMPYTRFVKTDLDWCSIEELKYFISQAKVHGLQVMNFFMHSYSLLKIDKTFNNIQLDSDKLQKLQEFIKHCKADNETQFVNIPTFYELYKKNKENFASPEFVPCYTTEDNLFKLGKKVLKKIFI